jgi:hypothetical protein
VPYSVAQLITEKAKFLNFVIANESKCLILNATNTIAIGTLNIVECWMSILPLAEVQITSILMPGTIRHNRTSPVVGNITNIAKSASPPKTTTSNWQLQYRVKGTCCSITSRIPNIYFRLYWLTQPLQH